MVPGAGGLQPEKMRLRDTEWLPSGLACHRENTSQEEEPQMCLPSVRTLRKKGKELNLQQKVSFRFAT